MKPDAYGWDRVHAVDGSGLDYSTTVFDPEIHVIATGPASDAHGRAFPATAPEVVEEPTPLSLIPGPPDPPKTKTEPKEGQK